MGLHDCRVAVNINNETGKEIALSMNKAECVFRILGESEG